MANLLNAESNLLEIAGILGITKWQLQEGNYNGCSFHTLQALGSAISQSTVANTASTAVYSFNKLLGQTTTNPNTRSNLFLTTLALMNVNDELNFKLIRKKLPYSNQDNIENQGIGGWTFTINALFFGPDYLTALNNFLNACATPMAGSAYTLIHPIYGKITGNVYLNKVRCRYSSEAFQAVMVELLFEAEQGIAWTQNAITTTDTASRALIGILTAINGVSIAINAATFLGS